MTERTPQTPLNETLSSLEKLYIAQFNKAQYCFDSRPPSTQSGIHDQSPRQISIDHFESYQEYFGLSEYQSRQGRMLSYEHITLALPVGAYAVFEQYTPHIDNGELYLHTPGGHITQYAEVSSSDLSTYISEYFELTNQLNERLKVTYRARLMQGRCPLEKRDLWCVIEDQVNYIEPRLELKLAQEMHSRIYWLSKPPQLGGLRHIPLSSRYWMGEYYHKRLYRLPCSNELPGFEYEAKLSPKSLSIDESLLPYPVIERYQTESVRWYLPKGKGRVGFREGRASLVKKGKKTLIDGIMKRREEKTQGLSMWQLTQDLYGQSEIKDKSTFTDLITPPKHIEPRPNPQNHSDSESLLDPKKDLNHRENLLQMRRVKRQLYLMHPKSHRVYALCLDDCRAPKRLPFHQIELEYNGKLCLDLDLLNSHEWLSFHQQLKAAQALADSVPKAASRCLERARLFLSQDQTLSSEDDVKKLADLSGLIQENLSQSLIDTAVSAAPNQELAPDLEAEIIEEMKQVLESLIQQQSCQSSVQTKRSWLKGLGASSPKDKTNKSKKKKKRKDRNKDKSKENKTPTKSSKETLKKARK